MYFQPRIAFLAIGFFIVSITNAQQANSLLWRISGKDLKKPSYLFGTMHLTDQRLFNFSDALYASIDSVEGFALEIDFREYMDSMFMAGMRDARKEMQDKETMLFERKKFGKEAQGIMKEFGIDSDYINKKQLKNIRDKRMNQFIQKGEMETIVDGFLYSIASRKGKWTGALEDVADQLNLSDELGGDLSPESVFVPEKKMRESLEKMISIYLKEDLDGIENFSKGYSPDFIDAVLIERNKKMSRRIDSLSAIRTMFYAVGAAHLPGESGIIQLLRKNGYTVEPVRGQKKIHGKEYVKTLASIPWQPVTEEGLPYEIQMPGAPNSFNVFNESFPAKMMFDITTMNFYLIGYIPGFSRTEEELIEAFGDMSKEMTGKIVKPKKIQVKDGVGYEGMLENLGISLRVQFIQANHVFYLLMVGTTKTSPGSLADAKNFLHSFRSVAIPESERKNYVFVEKDKKFSITFPGEPKKQEKENDAASIWDIVTYDYTDLSKQHYYMVQVRDTRGGYYLQGDSIYFDAIVTETEPGMEKITRKEKVDFNGFPAYHLDMIYEKNIGYRTMHILRGSRIYVLLVGGDTKTLHETDDFFRSFQFSDYPVLKWNKAQGPGFSSLAPSDFAREEKKEEEDEYAAVSELQSFHAYDPVRAQSYFVFKEPFPSYYWIASEKEYFNYKKTSYVEPGDSLLFSKTSTAGKLNVLDLVVKKHENHSLQRLRVIVSGDTLYTLMAYLPEPYFASGEYEKFFESFRPAMERAPLIYTNKMKPLMKALSSKDSSTFYKAKESFVTIEFSKGDLPHIYQGLFMDYLDEEENDPVSARMRNVIRNIGDSSSVDFLFKAYSGLSPAHEKRKYDILGMLAGITTEHSYSKIRSLLRKGAPAAGKHGEFEYQLLDSLELTATLFPEILHLSKDSLFADAIYDISRQLVEKELISLDMVTPFRPNFFEHAKNNLNTLRTNHESWWKYNFWIRFIAMWNDREAISLLHEFMKLPPVGLKKAAILKLLEHKQVVPPAEIMLVAKDSNYRYIFYEDLKKIDRLELFPSVYANQKSIAESQVYDIASDEMRVSSVLFHKEHIVRENGKSLKYLLFKVGYESEEGEAFFLGVAGPYDPGSGEIVSDADHSGVYWNEHFNIITLMDQLKKYLEGL